MSRDSVVVVGHRNPDSDSICSAIAYAELCRRQGRTEVRPARAGELNRQTEFILETLGVAPPERVHDVFPRVRDILDGELFYPSSIVLGARLDNMTAVPPGSAGVPPAEIGLTDRQAQVLALMVRGLSNREIAEKLGLSEGTVKIHATAIFKALGVGSRTQALVSVARYGVDFSKVF